MLIRDGLVDEAFVRDRVEGFTALADLVQFVTPEVVAEITGVPAADLVQVAHLWGEARTGSIAWGLGVTEQRYGSECVQMICNLALLTGKIGRPGCTLMPLRGQNNVQGVSDIGAARLLLDLPPRRRRVGGNAVRGDVGRAAAPRARPLAARDA